MANHVSSENARQTEVHRLRNRANMSTMKTAVKKFLKLCKKDFFSN